MTFAFACIISLQEPKNNHAYPVKLQIQPVFVARRILLTRVNTTKCYSFTTQRQDFETARYY